MNMSLFSFLSHSIIDTHTPSKYLTLNLLVHSYMKIILTSFFNSTRFSDYVKCESGQRYVHLCATFLKSTMKILAYLSECV